ncbi:hypothetical protein S40288_10984 [Stachybotrys chartarum IBT 40288]|nr:hypothetical protein S40288_10984 [Stachybotrys chartarum IBT 40288]
MVCESRSSSVSPKSDAKARRSTAKLFKKEAFPVTPSRTSNGSPRKTPRETEWTHRPPTDEQRKSNGRKVGRSLIMWNRKHPRLLPLLVFSSRECSSPMGTGPRMNDKLLLHLVYECHRQNIQLPWVDVAHRLRPGSSGEAVTQHMARLRGELLNEGHVVPPKTGKGADGASTDPMVRGYVKEQSDVDGSWNVREVYYDEKIDDLRSESRPSSSNSMDSFDEMNVSKEEPQGQTDAFSSPIMPGQVQEVACGRVGGFKEPSSLVTSFAESMGSSFGESMNSSFGESIMTSCESDYNADLMDYAGINTVNTGSMFNNTHLQLPDPFVDHSPAVLPAQCAAVDLTAPLVGTSSLSTMPTPQVDALGYQHHAANMLPLLTAPDGSTFVGVPAGTYFSCLGYVPSQMAAPVMPLYGYPERPLYPPHSGSFSTAFESQSGHFPTPGSSLVFHEGSELHEIDPVL